MDVRVHRLVAVMRTDEIVLPGIGSSGRGENGLAFPRQRFVIAAVALVVGMGFQPLVGAFRQSQARGSCVA